MHEQLNTEINQEPQNIFQSAQLQISSWVSLVLLLLPKFLFCEKIDLNMICLPSNLEEPFNLVWDAMRQCGNHKVQVGIQ